MDHPTYRQSESGCIYRRGLAGNEVLTPWGWTLSVFLLGQSGWQQILRMTAPVAIDPDWPA